MVNVWGLIFPQYRLYKLEISLEMLPHILYNRVVPILGGLRHMFPTERSLTKAIVPRHFCSNIIQLFARPDAKRDQSSGNYYRSICRRPHLPRQIRPRRCDGRKRVTQLWSGWQRLLSAYLDLPVPGMPVTPPLPVSATSTALQSVPCGVCRPANPVKIRDNQV